jgi:putative component of membrane protein insertase Oxa1/YidC/SpoIIIJ protein YidD
MMINSEPWGKDADMAVKSNKPIEHNNTSLLARTANNIILFHQNVLTKVDGPRSSFRPSSSRYMQLAIKRYGFLKGYIMGCDRLLRENDEKWVYKKIITDNIEYKYDPACLDKHYK